ncbi:MAG: hypothetical protein GWN62_25595 [Aliifodinibius sp.]|nr:hypothetical protein [Fodinibius sp.]
MDLEPWTFLYEEFVSARVLRYFGASSKNVGELAHSTHFVGEMEWWSGGLPAKCLWAGAMKH